MEMEKIILRNLTQNEEFARKTFPFLNTDYFTTPTTQKAFDLISALFSKYNKLPNKETLGIAIVNESNINEDQFENIKQLFVELFSEKPSDNEEWLLDETEKFCKDRAVYNAIMKSINIIDGDDKEFDKGAIPSILSDALSVSFDNYVGHDYIENSDDRFEFYHSEEERIPFDLEYFNIITKGGLARKSLNIILAGTGVGKTLTMCHFAAANLMAGKNVLYITMEMAEERIAERIDANLLSIPLNDLMSIPHEMFDSKIINLKKKTTGKLIVKEYPTAAAHSGHFRHLLNELRLKKDFVPDIIYIDYLNICASSRMKLGNSINTYSLVKSIAEELRGLAIEFNLPIVSASQLNRTGFVNSDPGLEDTSESWGLPQTADFMVALVTSEILEAHNHIQVKQLKNRWGDIAENRRFVVGIDKPYMRLYDVEQHVQDEVMDDTPVMDKGAIGQRIQSERFNLFN